MGCWWTNFAATGDPNRGPTGCAKELPNWAPVGSAGDTMVIANASLAMRPGLKRDACDAFAAFP